MTRDELIRQIFERKSFLCVGLDPDMDKLPKHLLSEANPIYAFNRAIIDATAPYCVCYKPNLAFYEQLGNEGMDAFAQTITYLQEHYPHHLIIADAKRGDIGNTSKMYARSFFHHYGVDAVTVAPYMGVDSVSPFLTYPDKWVVLLALTSNKGSVDFQLTESRDGERLFEKVLRVSSAWGTSENMMYVVGATRGELIGDVRKIVPHHFLLVPGVGAQGGSLADVCRYGMTRECGLLVNSSRGILYASDGTDFATAAGAAAHALQQEMEAQLQALAK